MPNDHAAMSRHRSHPGSVRPGHEAVQSDPSSPTLPTSRPDHPTLRANSYPEVTNLFCRLPLPTLFHQLEAVHLGDLLRLWVRPDVRIRLHAPLDFQGPSRAHRTPQKCGALPANKTLSPLNRFQGSASGLLRRGENSPRGMPASPGSFTLPLLSIHILVPEY